MESNNNFAPIVSLAAVAPSLDSSPTKSPQNCVVPLELNEKNEVRFDTASLSTRSSSPSSSSSEEDDQPKIPDGGWGWMVVFSSTILSMIADGISFSFGLLYGEFLKEFNASNSATSWIGSLFLAVPLLTGPIMSALVDKYGCRLMTIVGGIISAIGFIISSKCSSIGLMYLNFGILSGLGLGLCYVTAVVSIAFWFDKKRTLAVGLGASGTGIGTFVFSPITNFLINEYGWRGTTLILGGCLLNICVCGALMRDPDWIIEQNSKPSKRSKSEKSSKTSLESVTSGSNSIDLNELKHLLTSGKDVEFLLQKLETSLDNNEDKAKLKKYFSSALNLPTFIKQNEKVPLEVLELLSGNKKLYNVILQNYPSLLMSRSTSLDNTLNRIKDAPIDRVPVTLNMKLKREVRPKLSEIHQVSLPENHEPLPEEPLMGYKNPRMPPNASFPRLKQAWHYTPKHDTYFKNLKVHRQSLIHRGAIFNMNKYRFKASSCPNIYRVSMMSLPKEKEEKWSTEIVDLVKGMFDYSLFLELHFFLLSLSTIILFVWFIVPYFYVAELMLKHHYTMEDASFTISNIGIANTIGMVFLGWAGDRSWMNITKTYAVCLVLCGISIAGIMMFIENFLVMEIWASLFGLFLSSTFSFTPGILVELVPLERFTIAYGLQLLCMGIGILLGPPYAGLLYDQSKSWQQPFYQAAIWTVLSGIFIGLIPYTKNRKIIGKGPVEKEIEDSEDRLIPIIVQIVIMVILVIFVAYLTVQSFVNTTPIFPENN
ncbi:monocarboxylate transporter 14-like [Sitophilus oryzae]|uniref:Monocarboxylate transporter 14-like n=1 Tax=Sitophilus oryzae TaxID=7048 RepID=A0A6J2YJ30_SITOR|nr:monocarboxylate transporter 14-like [Sitophilus oryzae]XP_030763159.1 monocarboxylate transporter 14-like [Sitophilus oryzae]XP_030763161.1 monocarboxylate transporter 14-like [Sitophilus oryzae]XP_030763162.1 monocarboxylate transporter 14-like [Sitophilus oryzae]